MKKSLFTVICAAILLTALPLEADAAPSHSAHAAILLHGDTGTVLYETNADKRMLIASTTKIMTAMIALEHCSLDEQVEIAPEAADIEGSSIYLKAGESHSIKDLLYGMMLASGNDAAAAIACHVGGSIAGFAAMMNRKAQELGLRNTHFENPHGLDGENHYSTARDLAAISVAAMKNTAFREIVSTRQYVIGDQPLTNHNKLLWQYDGALGIKTGYTKQAGRILVSCAEREGIQLICVTISDPDDWKDHAAMYDWAFKNYEYPCVLSADEVFQVPIISGVTDSALVSPRENIHVLLKKDTDYSVKYYLPGFAFAGIHAGEPAGSVVVRAGDDVYEADLYYRVSVEPDTSILLTPLERLKRAFGILMHYGPVSLGYYC